MSEYQSYEFLAIDSPLTPKQQRELREISTRAEITSTRFWNDYPRDEELFNDEQFAELVPLRGRLLHGDLRCAYLGWLASVGRSAARSGAKAPLRPAVSLRLRPGLDELAEHDAKGPLTDRISR